MKTPVIIMGDLNSRTGELDDFIDIEKTDLNGTPPPPARCCTPKPRKNLDKTFNNMGLKLIDLCKSHDLQILNGRSIGDPFGYFTFHDTLQGASTIDLAVLSDPLVKRVKTFSVNTPNDYSHHCKIVLRLDNIIKPPTTDEIVEYKWMELDTKFLWQDESEENFKKALKSVQAKTIARECQQYLDAGLVEPAAKKMSDMFIEAANQSLKVEKKTLIRSDKYKHKKKWKKWFDQECHEQKNVTRKLAIEKHQHPEDKNLRKTHNEAVSYTHLTLPTKRIV